MTTLEPGEILRATLPSGYALTMYAVLHELGASQCVVNKPVLLNDEEEREIREWVDGDSLGVPGGWFPPDDWRLRALRKVHKFQNAFTGETLSAIMQNLCRADVPEDVDMRWRADAHKEEGESAGGGEPSHEPEPAPAPAPRKPLYYKEGPNETPWDSLGGPPIDPQCEYKDMVEWLSSGTATIDGHLVGPHKTSKASGDKAQDKRVNAECRSILHKRCGKTWLIQSKNNEAWHCRGRRPDDSWDGSIHAGTAIKSEEAKSEDAVEEEEAGPETLKPLKFADAKAMATHMALTYAIDAIHAAMKKYSKCRTSAKANAVEAKEADSLKLAGLFMKDGLTLMMPVGVNGQEELCTDPPDAFQDDALPPPLPKVKPFVRISTKRGAVEQPPKRRTKATKTADA